MGAAAKSEVVGLNEWPGSGLVGGGGERGCVWVCRQACRVALRWWEGEEGRRRAGFRPARSNDAPNKLVSRRLCPRSAAFPDSLQSHLDALEPPALCTLPTVSARRPARSFRSRPRSRFPPGPLYSTHALGPWSRRSLRVVCAGPLSGVGPRTRARARAGNMHMSPAHRPLQTLLQAGKFLSRGSESITRSGSAKRGRGAARLQDSAASERCPISPPHQPARARCCDG